MPFGAIIIGDEILRGKRQDKHLAKVIEILGARGLTLDWAEYLGDSPERITATLVRTFATRDVVFSFGGIGATPDDHTRQCVAAAIGVDLVLHPEGERLIRARFGAETPVPPEDGRARAARRSSEQLQPDPGLAPTTISCRGFR
jgi:molybdopterin-biosynthesis enzyme MoeA-like protein